jgi:hypothetical protein
MVRLTSGDMTTLGLRSFDDIVEITSRKGIKGYARATIMSSAEEGNLSARVQIFSTLLASLGLDFWSPEGRMRIMEQMTTMGYDEETSLRISKHDVNPPSADRIVLAYEKPGLIMGPPLPNGQSISSLSEIEKYHLTLYFEGFPLWNGLYVFVPSRRNAAGLFKVKALEPDNNPCLICTSQTKIELEQSRS